MRSEGYYVNGNQLTPAGIEPAAFRFVAQHLNHCATAVPTPCILLFNPLKAELNPICHLLALLGVHHIFHVSGLRVNSVSYVFLLCSCILIVMYVLFCILCLHRGNWHSPTSLTEAFPCFFLSFKANASVYLAKMWHGPRSSQFVNCVVVCIVCVDCVVLCTVCV